VTDTPTPPPADPALLAAANRALSDEIDQLQREREALERVVEAARACMRPGTLPAGRRMLAYALAALDGDEE